jgi:hypothetical protein
MVNFTFNKMFILLELSFGIIPPSLNIDLPWIGLVDTQKQDVNGIIGSLLLSQLLENREVFVIEVVGWVPIVVRYLIRNAFKGLVLINNFLPECFISSIVKLTEIIFWVSFLKRIKISSEDSMGKIEENFSQNGEMTMIVKKFVVSMCAAS